MGKAPNGEGVIAFKGDSHESLSGLVARGMRLSFDAVYVDASHVVRLVPPEVSRGVWGTM